MGGSPASSSFPLPPADEPPSPTTPFAIDTSGSPLTLVFDKPVAAGTITTGQVITHRVGGFKYANTTQAFSAGSSIDLAMSLVSAEASGTTRTDYLGTFSQFVGTNGLAVAPFTNVPTTIVS